MRDLLDDTVTHLPHHVLIQPLIERHLREDSALGLVVVNVEGLDAIEESYGPLEYQRIVREFSQHLQLLKGKTIRDSDYLALSELGGSSFMIFLTARRSNNGKSMRPLKRGDVDHVASRIRDELLMGLIKALGKHAHGLPKISIGQAFVVHNPLIRKRRLINKLIEEARETARMHKPILIKHYRDLLHRIIVNREIKTHFQPILSASTQQVMGLEALSRGPKGTLFESPLALFSVAEELNLMVELDRLCRQTALSYLKHMPPHCKLFVNTLPKGLQDPHLQKYRPLEAGQETIVLEINEREAIGNFETFQKMMETYATHGIGFAVDDVGAGYSSLECIVKLRPKYLKIDRSLIHEVQSDGVKQDMLKMLSQFAVRIDAKVVAEGIETKADSDFVREMGIQFVQGYHYARPMCFDDVVKQGYLRKRTPS